MASNPNSSRQARRLSAMTNQSSEDFEPTLTPEQQEKHGDAVALQTVNFVAASPMGANAAAQQLIETRERNEEVKMANKSAAEDLQKMQDELNDVVSSTTLMVPPDMYRASMQAKVAAEALLKGTNEVQEGGLYKVEGQWVDANGNPAKKKSKTSDSKPAETETDEEDGA